MVADFKGERDTISIPTITAIIEDGIFLITAPTGEFSLLPRIFQHIRTARPIAPMMNAPRSAVPKFLIIAISFSPASTGDSPPKLSPRKSFICPISMVTATPAVNPMVMVTGINLIRLPARQSPRRIRIIPAMTVAIIKPSKPFVAMTPATIVANAAVGPEIFTRLPPRSDIVKPATMAV